MAQWFLVRDDREQGPFDDAQLRKLVADGLLSPDGFIRRDGWSAAVPAKDIKGLFTPSSASSSSTVKRPPPPPPRIEPAASPPPQLSEWHYAQNNVQYGPVTFSRLKDMANSGRLRSYDLVWKVGTPKWREARTIDGLFAASPAAQNSSAAQTPPAPATPAPAAVSGGAPLLWNPSFVRVLGFFLSWGVGAFLLARNWKALGETERARRSMIWSCSIFAWLLLAIVSPDTKAAENLFRLAWFVAFFCWAYFDAQPQVNYVRERLGDDYPRKDFMGLSTKTNVGNWKKILAGCFLFAVVFVVIVAVSENGPRSTVAWLKSAGKPSDKQQGEAIQESAASTKQPVTKSNGRKKGSAPLGRDFFPVVVGKTKVYHKKLFLPNGKLTVEIITEEIGQPDGSIKLKETTRGPYLPADTIERNITGDAGLVAIGPQFEDDFNQSTLVRLEEENKSGTGQGHGRRAALEKIEFLIDSEGKKVRTKHEWFLEEHLGLIYEREWYSSVVVVERRLTAIKDAEGQSVPFAPFDDLVGSVSNGPNTAAEEPTSKALPRIPGARPLGVTVAEVGNDRDWVHRIRNPSLRNVKCYATDDTLIIDLDVDDTVWNRWPSNGLYPLLVRLFDKNGNYLTHFTTHEHFTALQRVFDMHKRQYDVVASRNRNLYKGVPKPVLLESSGNRLAYSVSVRDLRDAAIVEVGFAEVK